MTVKELKYLLEKYNDNDIVYARDIEGDFCRAIKIDTVKSDRGQRQGILFLTDGIEV